MTENKGSQSPGDKTRAAREHGKWKRPGVTFQIQKSYFWILTSDSFSSWSTSVSFRSSLLLPGFKHLCLSGLSLFSLPSWYNVLLSQVSPLCWWHANLYLLCFFPENLFFLSNFLKDMILTLMYYISLKLMSRLFSSFLCLYLFLLLPQLLAS